MENVMKHLTQVWRCACLYRMKQYEPLGIGMYQDSYLVAVCECPGITQEGIAQEQRGAADLLARREGVRLARARSRG